MRLKKKKGGYFGDCRVTGLDCVAGRFLVPEEDSGPDAVKAGDVSPGTSRSHDPATGERKKKNTIHLLNFSFRSSC